MKTSLQADTQWMRLAIRLARKGQFTVSPNPMVGAVIVKAGRVIGKGWHRRAGGPHAEIEALKDAQRLGHDVRGASVYATLEPCSTHGRTPPCTDALSKAGVRRVVLGALDPNPAHNGRGLALLRKARISVLQGVLGKECHGMNEAFNHWIVSKTPFVTVKAAMTLDGKIATRTGDSKWITGPESREFAMGMRRGSDAILVGINTILADDPQLTVRGDSEKSGRGRTRPIKRIILDTSARIPLSARVVSDKNAGDTTIVIGKGASLARIKKLQARVNVILAPVKDGRLDLRWVMKQLGDKLEVQKLLVEGGGEVNGSFLAEGLAHRVIFFYAPKILGGRESRPAVGGEGAKDWSGIIRLEEMKWRWFGPDLCLEARIAPRV